MSEEVELVFVKMGEQYSQQYAVEIGKVISNSLSEVMKKKINVIVFTTPLELLSKKQVLEMLEKCVK